MVKQPSEQTRRLPPIRIDPRTFLEDDVTLPRLSEVVDRVVGEIQSGNANAADVAELLASDPGLATQILRIVNSALYGLPYPIAQVEHAVAYLGLAETERIVLTADVMKHFPAAQSDVFRQFWFHSFLAATISKSIAKNHARTLDPAYPHTAVLLHDIGKLIYLQLFPDHHREMARFCQTERLLFNDAERHFDLPSHGLLGAILCDRWGLPEVIKRACEKHELEDLESLEESSPMGDEIRFVSLANLLSNLATENLTPEKKSLIRQTTLRALSCDEEDFLLLMGEIYDLKTDVEDFLGQL